MDENAYEKAVESIKDKLLSGEIDEADIKTTDFELECPCNIDLEQVNAYRMDYFRSIEELGQFTTVSTKSGHTYSLAIAYEEFHKLMQDV